jgi:hypothetical protein
MVRVTFIVTYVKLKIVHNSPFNPLKKKLRQEREVTLFGTGINPFLAVFQTILLYKPMRPQYHQLIETASWDGFPVVYRCPSDAQNSSKLTL